MEKNTMDFTKQLDPDLFEVSLSKCPIKGCVMETYPVQLLKHLTNYHYTKETFLETANEIRNVFEVDLLKLTPDLSHVVGIMAYASADSVYGTPLKRYHVPLLLMVYVNDVKPQTERVFVFYIVNLKKTCRASAHITMHYEPGGQIVPGRRHLRDLSNASLLDNDDVIYCDSMDCLIYLESDIWKDCEEKRKSTVQMEIYFRAEDKFLANINAYGPKKSTIFYPYDRPINQRFPLSLPKLDIKVEPGSKKISD